MKDAMQLSRTGCWSVFGALRRGFSLLVLVSLVYSGSALAQGSGVVEGTLVNGTDRSIVPSAVELEVLGVGAGMSIIKTAVTDDRGRFRIDGVSSDSTIMIRANYKSVSYIGQVLFNPAGRAQMEIVVYEPTTSMAGIRLKSLRMAFQVSGDNLDSIEEYSIDNQTKPPETFMNPEGSFRFSKATGIMELPRLSVAGPGSSMPLMQSPFESPDGQSYYSLFPLKPGTTTFEVQQVLPYSGRTYTYKKKFYQDVDSVEIGIIPRDLDFSGTGLQRVRVDPAQNFAVYTAGPVKAGTEVTWTFSGGTIATPPQMTENRGESQITPMPTAMARNALVIGPLVLLGLVAMLWLAFNRADAGSAQSRNPGAMELRQRRDRLVDYLAGLDNKFANQGLSRSEYLRQREIVKRQLRRIAMLIKQ